MITLSENFILCYLPTALGFQFVIVCPNSMILRAKRRHYLLKELEQSKDSRSTKSAAANRVTRKYKIQFHHGYFITEIS